MTTTTTAPAPAATGRHGTRRPSVGTALRWELVKLAAQARVRYGLLACLVTPPLVVLVLNAQQRPPQDTLFGRHLHESGYAVPLLLLGFAGQWLFPLLASLVAGDIFAGEDSQGTWKTLLTRSVSRTSVFVAKTLAAIGFTVLATALLAASTIASSVAIVGAQPLVGLTGQRIAPGHALSLVVASWGSELPSLVGFTALALLLSVLARNATVGVVAPIVLGFLMSLLGTLGGLTLVRRGLLTTGFESWHGLLVAHPFFGPLLTGIATSAVWTALCLTVALLVLRRRDITGG